VTAIDLSIATLRHRYAEGLSPVALVESLLPRLEAPDAHNTWIARLPREALLARARELEGADRTRLPLFGIPFAIKDNIDLAGVPTTAACPDFAYLPSRSATVVQRLLDAGAIALGKTNLDQFATGLVGARSPHGPGRNSFDPACVSGGSSSGSALAVALGLASFSLGTDTAGSGRVPAGLNGIVGLKPSFGLIPNQGVVPACPSLDCVSIFAASVADAALARSVMSGPDPWTRPAPARGPIRRLGLPRAADLHLDGSDQAAAWAASLPRFQGHALVEVDLSPFLEAARLLYEGAFLAERDAAFGALVPREAMHPVTQRILAGATRFTATDAFAAQHRLAALRAAAWTVWESVDALLLPTAPNFPTLADLAADPIGPNARLGTYTNFVNLMDLAALSIPGARRPDGLPFGVTLVAQAGADAALAAFAQRIGA
jgi:allophanate hydrolase